MLGSGLASGLMVGVVRVSLNRKVRVIMRSHAGLIIRQLVHHFHRKVRVITRTRVRVVKPSILPTATSRHPDQGSRLRGDEG